MAQRRHYESIDVLRGLSALAIALYHVRVDLWMGWNTIATDPTASSAVRVAALLSLPTPLFGQAVMLFFVVSGFCVHYQYTAGRTELSLRAYAIRRVFRIYPPYLAAALLTMLIEWGLYQWFGVPQSDWAKWLQSVFMVQNYLPTPGQMNANPSLWSLPVEMEFYLLYPLLVFSRAWLGLRGWMILSGLVSLSAAGLDLLGWRWLSGNFAEYWVLWCAGALLAEWDAVHPDRRWSTGRTIVLAAVFIAGAALVYVEAHVAIRNFVWGAAFFGLLMWCLVKTPRRSATHGRVWSALVGLGTISYSLYLIHYPFFKLCGAAWVSLAGQKPQSFLIPLLFTAAAIPVAYGFYCLVERPSVRLARRYSGRGTGDLPTDKIRARLLSSVHERHDLA